MLYQNPLTGRKINRHSKHLFQSANQMHSVCSALQSDGYVEIVETDPAASTLEVARELADTIGAVVSEPAQQLSPSPVDCKPLNTYGGNYGYGELPLHTDLAHWYLPPRYVLLRCVTGTPSVSTRLLHHLQIERRISTAVMRRALFSPRRRLDGKMYLLRMLGDELFRWDQLFLKPQNAPAREVSGLMRQLGSELPVTNIVFERAGHTLLIDNWQSLHGRSSVPTAETGRKLDRIYLETSAYGNKDSA